MAKITVEVPFRGEIAFVDGAFISPPGVDAVEPLDIQAVVAARVPWAGPGKRPSWGSVCHDYDFEAGTVAVDIECRDTAYLAAIEAQLAGVSRADEADVMESLERAQVQQERDGGDPRSTEEEEIRVANRRAVASKTPAASAETLQRLRDLPYRGTEAVLR